MTTLDPTTQIKSTTYEGALLEIVTDISNIQTDDATNANNVLMINNFTVNGLTKVITFTASIPFTVTTDDVTGDIVYDADEIFQDPV